MLTHTKVALNESLWCSTTYKVPSPNVGLDVYYADDFDFFEAETQRSDDPMTYMPDVDWATLMQRMFVIICAPRGVGKSEQVAQLYYPTAVPGGFWSLRSMSCLRSSKQVAAREAAMSTSTIRAVFDRLCICPNYLYKLRGRQTQWTTS